MKYVDVCFRLDSYYLNCGSKISSLLTEFSKPATWGEEGFDSSIDIISDAKEYIAELVECNGFPAIIREDSIIVMDRSDVLEIYYGFTPLFQQFNDTLDIKIEERSMESLLYYSYGKTDTDEIERFVPPEIEAFSCDEQEYQCMYIIMEAGEIFITLDICGVDSTELMVSIGREDTIDDVISNVNKEVLLFLKSSNLPY